MSYSQITPQIWLGPAIDNPQNVTDVTLVNAMMEEVKPTRLIDCRAEFDDKRLLIAAGVLKDPDVARFYLFDGIPDWTPEAAIGLKPIPDCFFKRGLDFWTQYQKQPGEVLYVHCSQGINRSVTLVYAILIAQGMSRVEAMVRLNAHRAVTGLNDFLDHPWRENAEHALHRLGYVVR
jgi:hypothetical protein